ncbi:phosphoenolpyruvate carboxylase [Candidatus Woesearchaeota archaeon]|nr:phosphoenolpyruvate carboxylase [Candidatus Woesearchaeota archaeon]
MKKDGNGRKIPATMATQHPDNASKPYWNNSEFVSSIQEEEECYRSFKELNCDEYMWDWEGKFCDEAVIDRLFNTYFKYFKQKQLGKHKFLTFRIPNVWVETGFRLVRAYMDIITANDSAVNLKLNSPPLFEVILPQTESADQILFIQSEYKKIMGAKSSMSQKAAPEELQVIPLMEEYKRLIDSRKILEEYIKKYKENFNKDVPYLRPFIARSDPALNAGLVPATLAARIALSEYYKLEKEKGIKLYPIVGVGSLPFRGGLNPRSIEKFIEQHPGVNTVTVQSAFRYDYPQNKAISAINKLNKELPKNKPKEINEELTKNLIDSSDMFAAIYQKTLVKLVPDILGIAHFIPSHRERILHSGFFNYGRKISGSKKTLPRAINFTACFYSLGVPPELIGTGRGLDAVEKKGLLDELEQGYPTLKKDLIEAGYYLNRENLKLLAKNRKGWDEVLKDIEFLELFAGKEFGPKTVEHFEHRNFVSNVFQMWKSHKHMYEHDLRKEIVEAAIIRKSLG